MLSKARPPGSSKLKAVAPGSTKQVTCSASSSDSSDCDDSDMSSSSSGGSDSSESQEASDAEQEPQTFEERQKRALQELPANGLKVYCSGGGESQHALWTGLPAWLEGEPVKDTFNLTDKHYRPRQPPVWVSGPVVETLGGCEQSRKWPQSLKLGCRFCGLPKGTSLKKFQLCLYGDQPRPCRSGRQKRGVLRAVLDLPQGGLKVTCGQGTRMQYAIWMSGQGSLDAGRCGSRFLLTNKQHKPLQPQQVVLGSKLEAMGGMGEKEKWKTSVRLAQEYMGVVPGCTLETLIRRVQTMQAQADSETSSSDGDEGDDADEEEEEEEGEQMDAQPAQTSGLPPSKRQKTGPGSSAGGAVSGQQVQSSKKVVKGDAPASQQPQSDNGGGTDVNLSQAPPLPPLQLNSHGELRLQSEIDLMDGLTRLLHVLGHGAMWHQLWERYLGFYTTSTHGMTSLLAHYKELQAAVQQGSVQGTCDVLRRRFKLSM